MPVEDDTIPLTPASKYFSSTKPPSSPKFPGLISLATTTDELPLVPAFGEAAGSHTVATPLKIGFSFDIDSPLAERVAFPEMGLRGIRKGDDNDTEWGETTSRRTTGGIGHRRWDSSFCVRNKLGNFGKKAKALYDAVYHKVPYAITGPPGTRILLTIRGVSGFFGLFSIYYSLQYLSLADMTVLTFLAPFVTALGGYLLLGESFSRKGAVAGLVSLIGVALIVRPEAIFGPLHNKVTHAGSGEVDIAVSTSPLAHVTPAQRLGAIGVLLLGVFAIAGAYISIRAVGTRLHTLHTTQWFAMWSIFVSTVGTLLSGVQPVIPTSFAWGTLLIAIGLCGFTAQVFLTLGLQRETASRASLGKYTQILFALIFELTLFHVAPSLLSMAGMVIILGSALFIVLTKSPLPPKKAKSWRIEAGSETRGDRDVGERVPLIAHEELPLK